MQQEKKFFLSLFVLVEKHESCTFDAGYKPE